ncbi:MAG: DNA alkylation repair protein [Rikenellaceae bacterium]|nr:DNA alkylation repair protein [Rikenellaceae bacterium]
MDATLKMTALLRELKNEMNGAVSGSMNDNGMRYGLNYGVSVPTIRSIARRYGPDNQLAELLIKQDVRELKLSAIYIADPEKMNLDGFRIWEQNLTTVELMDNASLFLLPFVGFWRGITDRWLESGSRLLVQGAMNIVGKLAKMKKIPAVELDEIFRNVARMIQIDPEISLRYCVYFFVSYNDFSEENKRILRSVLEEWNKDESLNFTAGEILSFVGNDQNIIDDSDTHY